MPIIKILTRCILILICSLSFHSLATDPEFPEPDLITDPLSLLDPDWKKTWGEILAEHQTSTQESVLVFTQKEKDKKSQEALLEFLEKFGLNSVEGDTRFVVAFVTETPPTLTLIRGLGTTLSKKVVTEIVDDFDSVVKEHGIHSALGNSIAIILSELSSPVAGMAQNAGIGKDLVNSKSKLVSRSLIWVLGVTILLIAFLLMFSADTRVTSREIRAIKSGKILWSELYFIFRKVKFPHAGVRGDW